MKYTMKNLLAVILAAASLASYSYSAQAADKVAGKAGKERIVLMPLRVSDEDSILQSAMETALVQGLQDKYEVFSGEQVSQKAREIFMKESVNTVVHKECDETRCMQDIAMAFQAELISTANVTKRQDGYFLVLSIRNIFDNKVVYSNSLPCRNCDAYQVVDKLKELSGSVNKTQKVETSFRDCPDCPVMEIIPSGSFNMGGNGKAETPAHRVTLAGFAIGKTEITQGQWRALMGNNPSEFKQCGDNCPVEKVSWDDAQAYIAKLNAKTGKQYRLPSEAEWEYACRAGGQHEYCGSDNAADIAWFVGSKKTYPVAAKQANAFGLYDMSGNVWEWVQDSAHENYANAPGDGAAWKGEGDKRILRGGSWYHDKEFLRAAARGSYKTDNRNGSFGFRVAISR